MEKIRFKMLEPVHPLTPQEIMNLQQLKARGKADELKWHYYLKGRQEMQEKIEEEKAQKGFVERCVEASHFMVPTVRKDGGAKFMRK